MDGEVVMNWYIILLMLFVFYCGFKAGKYSVFWLLTVGMQKLKLEDQIKFQELLRKIGEIDG